MGKHGTNIHKRADGRWEVRVVQGEPVNGKTNYKFLYGDTYQEAADKKREFERTLQSQRYADAVSSAADPFLCRVAQMMAASPVSSKTSAPSEVPAALADQALPSSPAPFANPDIPSPADAAAAAFPPSSASSAEKRATVREAALAWLSAKRPHVKESTYAYYKTEVECHILPVLGDLYMEDITQQRIADYQKTQKESGRMSDGGPLSSKTISDLNKILKQIFSYACTTGLLEQAPVFPSVSCRPKSVCIFTKKEQKRLEEFLKEEDTAFSIGVCLALHCGLRIGEVCALRWEDFDFQNETLRINKTVTRIGQTQEAEGAEGHKESAPAKTRLVITTPKTDYSIRTIPIPETILSYLKERRGEASVYVISGSEKFMEPRTCRRRFKRLLAQAGVPDHTFHCLRHTFATRCIEMGVDIKALSEILGHSDVKVTMQRYVHPTMEYKREQLNKLV